MLMVVVVMARARVAKGSTDLRPQELRTPGARGSALCLVGQPRGASSAIRRSLTCHHPHAIASPSPHRSARRPAQRRRERGAQLARHEQGGPPHVPPSCHATRLASRSFALASSLATLCSANYNQSQLRCLQKKHHFFTKILNAFHSPRSGARAIAHPISAQPGCQDCAAGTESAFARWATPMRTQVASEWKSTGGY